MNAGFVILPFPFGSHVYIIFSISSSFKFSLHSADNSFISSNVIYSKHKY